MLVNTWERYTPLQLHFHIYLFTDPENKLYSLGVESMIHFLPSPSKFTDQFANVNGSVLYEHIVMVHRYRLNLAHFSGI